MADIYQKLKSMKTIDSTILRILFFLMLFSLNSCVIPDEYEFWDIGDQQLSPEAEMIPGFKYLGQFESSHYYYSIASYSGDSAYKMSRSLPGHLLVINSARENDFLDRRVLMKCNRSWIGLSDWQQEGQYVWVNGDSLNYTCWGQWYYTYDPTHFDPSLCDSIPTSPICENDHFILRNEVDGADIIWPIWQNLNGSQEYHKMILEVPFEEL